MDQGPRTAPVTSPAGGPRRASIVAAAVVVAVALAIVKPWSLAQSGPGAGASSGTLPARGTPTRSAGAALASPTAPPGDPNAMACMADETEQVLAVERSAGREVRTWIAVPGIVAAGPLDPRLVPLTVFSSHVVGLGVCAASTNAGASSTPGSVGSAGSGGTLIDVRSVSILAGVATAVDLGPPQLLADPLNGRDPALLYGPPQIVGPVEPGSQATATARGTDTADSPSPSPSPSPVEATWRAGSYAIAFRFAFDDSTIVRWLRIDLVTGAGGGA